MSDLCTGTLELIQAATLARENAHAPYSEFKVGAAFRVSDGTIITGVNLENCSYGLTVCAERNALAAAVGQGLGGDGLVELVVVTDAEEVASPCGACRQVLAEILTLETPIILHNLRSVETVSTTLGRLLPSAFLPHSLRQNPDRQDD